MDPPTAQRADYPILATISSTVSHNSDGQPVTTATMHDMATRPIMKILEVFSAMVDVKTLDLAYLSKDHGHPLASGFPDLLFPSVSSVRLCGGFSYALAASILAHEPAKWSL